MAYYLCGYITPFEYNKGLNNIKNYPFILRCVVKDSRTFRIDKVIKMDERVKFFNLDQVFRENNQIRFSDDIDPKGEICAQLKDMDITGYHNGTIWKQINYKNNYDDSCDLTFVCYKNIFHLFPFGALMRMQF